MNALNIVYILAMSYEKYTTPSKRPVLIENKTRADTESYTEIAISV